MPSMYEIYDHHVEQYDELVDHEDWRGNLRRELRRLVRWDGCIVAEAGVGTGRVTRIYVDLVDLVFAFDRSAAMLRRARARLAPWGERVRLCGSEHRSLALPDATADVFVEGWAFGHAVTDLPAITEQVTAELVAEARRVTKPLGTLVFLETLGTNVREPTAPDPALARFYDELERRHGFARYVVRTDYRFDTREQAADLCGFFFGEEMGRSVAGIPETREAAGEPGGLVVPEFTGIWIR